MGVTGQWFARAMIFDKGERIGSPTPARLTISGPSWKRWSKPTSGLAWVAAQSGIAGLLPRDVVREQVQLFAKHVILRYA
jgi:hypothetical protein